MSDTLIYRIPGHEIIEQHGVFEITDINAVSTGFIIGDFTLNKVYVFKEIKDKIRTENQLFFSPKKIEVIEKQTYLDLAQHFLHAFDSNGIKKAVFSRIKKVGFDETKTQLLFSELEKKYPNAFVYLISSELFGTWVGASPEILLKVEGCAGFTIALAGTKQKNDYSEWGLKEQKEQAFVTDFILNQIQKNNLKCVDQKGPYEFSAGPVKHLRTDISFDMNGKSTMDSIKILHPTPAVSGIPQKKAIELILTMEEHDRQLYTGIIGVVDQEKSNIYVNLRCCQIKRGAAYLYLGGGFTEESNPELEWQETENKSKTLLNILQKL